MPADKPDQVQIWLPPGENLGQIAQIVATACAGAALLTLLPSLNGPIGLPVAFGLFTLYAVLGAPRVTISDEWVRFRLNGYWSEGETFRTIEIDSVEYDGTYFQLSTLRGPYEFGPFAMNVRLFFMRRVERVLSLIRERAAAARL